MKERWIKLLPSKHNQPYPHLTLLDTVRGNHITEQFGENDWIHTGLVVYRADASNGPGSEGLIFKNLKMILIQI